tara:strand:+ start:585 stop:803 length:219 start_codon:yes stop_codon:yes gene_type:complete
MIEEVFYPEPPEAVAIRYNTDALSHIATAYTAADDAAHCEILLELLQEHSKFIINTCEQVLLRNKFYIREFN